MSPYYRRVEADILDEAKTEILSVLKDGKDQGIILDVEFQVMDPTVKGPARFYETFKVLKSHEPGRSSPAPDQSPRTYSLMYNITLKISAINMHLI